MLNDVALSFFVSPDAHAMGNSDIISKLINGKLWHGLHDFCDTEYSKSIEPSLLKYIFDNVHLAEPFESSWQPAYGFINSYKPTSQDLVEKYFLQLALYIARSGASGTFEIDIQQKKVLFFDCFTVEVEGKIAFYSQPEEVSICIFSNSEFTKKKFIKENGLWNPEEIFDGDTDVFAFPWSNFSDENFCDGNGLSQKDRKDAVKLFRGSLEIIRRNSLPYYSWIRLILKGVIFYYPENNQVRSGSSSSHSGLIYLTYPSDVTHMATLIVHECSHQFAYLQSSLYAVINGDDKKLYYSPFRKISRPLFYIYLALHAAVNIQKFTASIIKNKIDCNSFVIDENNDLLSSIRTMLDEVSDSKGFTPLGLKSLLRLQELAGKQC